MTTHRSVVAREMTEAQYIDFLRLARSGLRAAQEQGIASPAFLRAERAFLAMCPVSVRFGCHYVALWQDDAPISASAWYFSKKHNAGVGTYANNHFNYTLFGYRGSGHGVACLRYGLAVARQQHNCYRVKALLGSAAGVAHYSAAGYGPHVWAADAHGRLFVDGPTENPIAPHLASREHPPPAAERMLNGAPRPIGGPLAELLRDRRGPYRLSAKLAQHYVEAWGLAN